LLKECQTKQWSAHILIVKQINDVREDNPFQEITGTFVHAKVVLAEMRQSTQWTPSGL
jgi:hypothetical protein